MTFAQPFHEYEVLDRVGSGSMGTVFKARHKKLNRIVALKVLKPSLARDTRYVERLRREARIVASLNHPNIVTGYDLGQESGYHFFVMEYVEGKSLRELLHEWGLFTEDRVLDVAIQITIALDHAFKKGVIHRDVKPGNILIDENNLVKLTDMGLAKGPDNLTITRDGATVGTPQYISPEQAKSPQDVDIRSDLYSLGATLFHMCTGQPPFRAETMANVLVKVLEERAPSAVGINPDLSDGLNLIIRKLLSKNPGRRYQTPAELLADLERVQRSERPEVDIGELDSGDTRRSSLAWVALALILPAAAFSYWLANRDTAPPVVSTASLRAEYREQIQGELRAREKIGDKLLWIRELETAVEKDLQREVLEEQRKRWEQALEDQLPTLMRGEERDLAATLEGLRWIDTEGDMQRHIADRIKERFGVEVSKLPEGALREYELGWSVIEQQLPQHTRTRESEFQRAVDGYTEKIRMELLQDIRAGDLVRAERRFQAQSDLGLYGGLVGSPPVEQLPDNLRSYVQRVRSAAANRAQAAIEARESELVAEFRSALDDVLAANRADRISSIDEFERLERELTVDFPVAQFRPDSNPWSGARPRLRSARIALRERLAAADQRSFGLALQFAYGIAIRGDLTAAAEELALYAGSAEPERVTAHKALLHAAATVRQKLLGRLLPEPSANRRIRVALARGENPVPVDLSREGAEIVLRHDKADLSLALLKVRALVELAGDEFVRELAGDERAGLALWYVLSGERSVASLVEEDYRELFRRDIFELDVRSSAPDALIAQEELETVRTKIAKGQWVEAETALGKLRAAHVKFAKEWTPELELIERRIAQGKQRQAVVKRLEKLRKPGMRIVVEDDLSVRMDFDLTRSRFAPEDRVGWNQAPLGPLRFASEGLGLTEARLRSLVLPTLVSIDAPVTAAVDLSFPEENEKPRLVFLGCHGATVGIGLMRNGIVVVIPVDGELVANRELMQKAQKALESAERRALAYVVPGARHRLELSVRQKRGSRHSVVVTVRMDEVDLLKGAVLRRRGNPQPHVSITPLTPLAIHRLAVRGRG